MEARMSGEGDPGCPLTVWIVRTDGDWMAASGLCPCFNSAVWGSVGGTCLGCIH